MMTKGRRGWFRRNPDPSSHDILSAFPQLPKADADKLARSIQRASYPGAVDKALDLANKLLGGYGVEAITDPDRHVSNYYMGIIALYVNMGDTYTTTLIYDTEQREFFLTDYGSWLEAAEAEREEDEDDGEDDGESEDESEEDDDTDDVIRW